MTPRTRLSRPDWQNLAATPHPALIGLWADTREVHALLAGPLLVSTAVENGSYPALSAVRPQAAAFERAVCDLWGHRAEGGDPRPWFHTVDWPVIHPMSGRPLPRTGEADPEEPAPVPENRQVALGGPVRFGLREPALLRLVTDGRVVEAAEYRLGYAHKGTTLLMRSKSPRAAARFASRIQADSAVAHSLAFARAAEDASGAEPPPRSAALRLLMLAVESVSASLAASRTAEAGPLLDAVRRASALAFGHRLMMDCIVPGGVLADPRPEGVDALRAVLDRLPSSAAVEAALGQLSELPPGPLSVNLPPSSGEGLGHAPTLRGTVWHWLRLDNGTVANAFACDPAALAWHRFAAGLPGQEPGPRGIPDEPPGLLVSGADL